MRTIFDGMTQEKSPKPIIAYFGGMKSGKLRYWNYNNTTATDYSTYPYAGHVDDLTSPNYDLAFDVQDFYYYLTPQSSGVTTTDNNLYNQFHKSQWEQIGNKDSKLVEAWFKLRPNDIANLDFRKTYWVKDNAYRLLTVQDYDPNGDSTTLCKLLKFAYQDAFVPTVVTSNGGNGQGEKDGGYNTNGNVIKKGLLATGGNVINDNTNGIVVTGNGNNLGGDNANIVILGDNNVILPGIVNVTLINTSGLTIAESDVQYIDNIKFDLSTTTNNHVLTYKSADNTAKWVAPSGGGGGGSGGITWNNVTGTADTMIKDNAYLANNAGLVTLTLPVSLSVLDTFVISGAGAGGWKIAQRAGQQIIWDEGGVNGTNNTTSGATGYLASTDDYDHVELVAISSTTLKVTNSKGLITLV